MSEKVYIDNLEFHQEFENHLLLDGVKFHVENNTIRTKDFEFTFSPEFSGAISKFSPFQNALIHGKNTVLGITALEVVDDEEDTFVQIWFKDGSSKKLPYKRWVLIDKQVDMLCKPLEGENVFKYIRYFSSKTEIEEFCGRYRKSRKIFRLWNDREAAMALHGIGLFKGLGLEDVSVLGFDIEAAGLTHDEDSEVFLITNVLKKGGVYIEKHFRLDEWKNSAEMIDAWCAWVRENDPDVLCPWNGFGYDLPYLEHVAKMGKTKLSLGRDGSKVEFKKKPSEKRVDGSTSWTYHKAHIFGRHIVDGMFLAVTYDVFRKYPTWRLKDIAAFEGLHKPDRTFVDASKIAQYWLDPVMRENVVKYGIDDSYDSIKLFELMIPAFFYTAQSVAKPFEEMMQGATGAWINSIMVRSYLQQGETIPEADEPVYVKGGMSYGIPGVYSNVAKWDVVSMYPSIILEHGLYPVKKDPRKYFLQLMLHFTEQRLEQKAKFKTTGIKIYDDLQGASKIFINSGFGAMGTPGLNFNDFSVANAITRHGRNTLKLAIEWATGKKVTEWWTEYSEEGD